jgi:tRNA (guanine-N7-)-methyltransferase
MTDIPTPKPQGAPDHVTHPQTIRSFVRRAGRTTTGQTKALAELGPQYIVPFARQTLDYAQTFGRDAPVILEIGFGMGETTARIAATRPDDNFLACEVHEPGVGALLKRMGEENIHNIRIVSHDAVEVLEHMIAPLSLAGVHIYFPDPWHKKKHNKRRLIQPAFVQQLCRHIAPGGYLHCATDWQAYAEQILEVLSAEPTLANTSAHANGYADKPAYRPLTKFENRGIKLGHGVWDVVFAKGA